MRFLLFGGFYFGKMWKNLEKRPFFRADMARLGKYCKGGYGRIGVYRVKQRISDKHIDSPISRKSEVFTKPLVFLRIFCLLLSYCKRTASGGTFAFLEVNLISQVQHINNS